MIEMAMSFLYFLVIVFSTTEVISQGIQWVTPDSGKVPPHPWVGGYVKNKSEIYYVCLGREQHEESVVCGKTSLHIGIENCILPYDNNELRRRTEKILTLPVWVPYTLQWVQGYTHGRIPPNAVECGDMVYVGRFLKGSDVIPGKVDPLNQAFFYVEDHSEKYKEDGYEVLVRRDFA